METQNLINYNRIAEAIKYLAENFKRQPTLEELAEEVHLSSFHFQRLFSEWAGVSPKKFIQFLSVTYAKSVLKGEGATIADAAFETGLSGTSRLHDLFIKIEGMTPGEYKNNGEELCLKYSFSETAFGEVLIASTSKGICHLSFVEDKEEAFRTLRQNFPKARFEQQTDKLQQGALQVFSGDWHNLNQVKLHLKGTPFQLKVWEALLKIPLGSLASYTSVAAQIKNTAACRAVGSAIGSNPVAFIIPCHRVIKSTGVIGQYHWGTVRKQAMIGWEASKIAGIFETNKS